jgi:hypothetical protein
MMGMCTLALGLELELELELELALGLEQELVLVLAPELAQDWAQGLAQALDLELSVHCMFVGFAQTRMPPLPCER